MKRAVFLLFMATALIAAPQVTKTTHSKSAAAATVHPAAHTASSKTAVSKGSSARLVRTGSTSRGAGRKAVRGKRKAAAPPAPSYQLHPDPERYTQIQQALTDRGYFKGPVNGEWGDDSVDALKRFQADQKLDTDGKINALTLTGLGLGPKHDGSTASSVSLAATAPLPEPPAELPGNQTPPSSTPLDPPR